MKKLIEKLKRVKDRKWASINQKGRKYNPDEIENATAIVNNGKTRFNLRLHRRGHRRNLTGSKRNQKEHRRRKRIIERKRDEFKELFREVNDIDLPKNMFN